MRAEPGFSSKLIFLFCRWLCCTEAWTIQAATMERSPLAVGASSTHATPTPAGSTGKKRTLAPASVEDVVAYIEEKLGECEEGKSAVRAVKEQEIDGQVRGRLHLALCNLPFPMVCPHAAPLACPLHWLLGLRGQPLALHISCIPCLARYCA